MSIMYQPCPVQELQGVFILIKEAYQEGITHIRFIHFLSPSLTSKSYNYVTF